MKKKLPIKDDEIRKAVRKLKSNAITSTAQDVWAKRMRDIYNSWMIQILRNTKPLSKLQADKFEKKRIKLENFYHEKVAKEEAIRRAQKITMTVGELEDKLQDARYDNDE